MLRQLIKSIPASSSLVNTVRTLYSSESLGVDKYLYSKEKISTQFVSSTQKFVEKMKEYSQSPEHMIFTEDLKNMAHLVQSDDDIVLVESMMKKFNSQNKELRFGNFVFGKRHEGSKHRSSGTP